MPVMDTSLPQDALRLASRRASVARQLDLMIDLRGPVDQVRRLIADLDSISADLSKAMREADAAAESSRR
jgi:hypothetical protein